VDVPGVKEPGREILKKKGAIMKIYVGNLAYQVTEEDLRTAFASFGQVDSVSVIKDKFSGESKGFAFVEMTDSAQAQAAIAGLNSKEIKGRNINVNEARPTTGGRPGGGRSGGGRPGGGGGRSSY
jgi:RNA recognition motif-containing protein